MVPNRDERRARYLAKTREEIGALAKHGVVMAGNAFSSVLLLKGEPSPDEHEGKSLLGGDDGRALRAALQALGYAPEDWAGLATWDADGASLTPELLREAVCTLDPATLVLCDVPATMLVREAYAEELALLERFDEAMLMDGVVVQVGGMRVMALGGFAAALADPHDKQVMWARLKQLPPLGEPY